MMEITHLIKLFITQFQGKSITPDALAEKILKVNAALEVTKNPNIPIQFSFGNSIKDENLFGDWNEITCFPLAELPDTMKSKKYRLYDLYYDGEYGYIEALLEEV